MVLKTLTRFRTKGRGTPSNACDRKEPLHVAALAERVSWAPLRRSGALHRGLMLVERISKSSSIGNLAPAEHRVTLRRQLSYFAANLFLMWASQKKSEAVAPTSFFFLSYYRKKNEIDASPSNPKTPCGQEPWTDPSDNHIQWPNSSVVALS